MENVLDGGEEATKRKRFILGPLFAVEGVGSQINMSRQELMAKHFDDFIAIHKSHMENGYIPQRDEVNWMSACATNTGSIMPHLGLFLPTSE